MWKAPRKSVSFFGALASCAENAGGCSGGLFRKTGNNGFHVTVTGPPVSGCRCSGCLPLLRVFLGPAVFPLRATRPFPLREITRSRETAQAADPAPPSQATCHCKIGRQCRLGYVLQFPFCNRTASEAPLRNGSTSAAPVYCGSFSPFLGSLHTPPSLPSPPRNSSFGYSNWCEYIYI
ncbi:uncharacterized protein KNAG_0C00600 [Huiozyma naganishii CBS 8797]|uniref:Uncharacterized protein n=1 Tax=Huiozyma naganishii (strain ATCC MYA-139 / BCRC 22969 / CBS 8797 / KCTC 17520 / NBRC 10181 / NCYC 3082 / Yp74L-3) TaxID=1071383 RepID=J7S4A1_HUIN7|nr:hypothetical protein KNAG_0C00600 [Kazachstania naganishii CBS 8797]CCK69174.1 hypothetical protein KNAG_0C00600 [Kazachstania naganishii CBS 8797]